MKYLFTLLLITSCSSNTPHWGYSGDSSPEQWGELSSDYKSCDIGHKQSPIDLSTQTSKKSSETISFHYQDTETEIIDNGHTIQAKFNNDNFIKIKNKKYYLSQLHFHIHSEHSIDGIFYPIEMHLVHQSKDKKLSVLAFFVEISGDELDHFGFFKGIKSKSHKSVIKLKKLMSYVGSHFYYEGSLTTPPCTEGVHWVIFDKHIKLHRSQVGSFKAIYTRNYRPTQNRKGHHQVFHSSI